MSDKRINGDFYMKSNTLLTNDDVMGWNVNQ